MKTSLLVVTAAMFSPYATPFLPLPLRAPRQSASATQDLAGIIRLARNDAAKSLLTTALDDRHAASSAPVKAEPAELRSGLARLMSASVRTMRGRSPKMKLTILSSSDKVTLELRDNGAGLSVNDIIAMYGTGSSDLAEARRKIEKAGGAINVSSLVGAGTVYSIDLPIAPGRG